jgi:acyl-coenzyme A thioesterase PaaI-like protein
MVLRHERDAEPSSSDGKDGSGPHHATGTRFHGHTHPAYANMVGPYGGITAATLLRAVLDHPDVLGEPIALTVNFAGPVADGPFVIDAQPARTNNSTQHWVVTQTSGDGSDRAAAPATTATVVTARRRDTWSTSDAPLPAVPAADTLPRVQRLAGGPAWLNRYEMRPILGQLPRAWDGSEQHSLTRMWVRDDPLRALDFPGLTALADSFLPVVWLRRAKRTLIGTVSMSVYFHATGDQLAATGHGLLMAQAQGQAFHQGFFDHTAQLWNEAGHLLATTHQIVYYKD